MVELLTDYTTQIYHALSTDARPDAEPGAQLREIDTGKRFIFDGNTWQELPEGGGGGGGGEPVYGLLTEINITEPISEIRYDLPALVLADGKLWAEYVDVTLSAADYLYANVVGSGDPASDMSGYFDQAASISAGYTNHVFTSARTFNGNAFHGLSATYVQGTSRTTLRQKGAWTPTTFKARCYTASHTITGGTIRIYGRIG